MRPLALLLLVACQSPPKAGENLDLDLIEISGDAKLRTDSVGVGKHETVSTFVLVDAKNKGGQGAYVSLGGELVDEGGKTLGTLKAQSLWVPAGESRTFALVDTEREERPATARARIKVRGALISDPAPHVRVEGERSYDDFGKVVLQGRIVNDYDRWGTVMVIASFYDAQETPMTRPFQLLRIGAAGSGAEVNCPEADTDPRGNPATSPRCSIQFVGPQGSKRGKIFIGEVVY